MEHSKITFTRQYCRSKGIRYQIKGVNDALFLYDKEQRAYIQICFSLLNLNEDQITDMIDEFVS